MASHSGPTSQVALIAPASVVPAAAPPSPYTPPPRAVEPAVVVAGPRGLPAAAVDPLHRQRRAYLLQQVAVVVMLLLVACGVGVALGVHDSSDADVDAPTRQ